MNAFMCLAWLFGVCAELLAIPSIAMEWISKYFEKLAKGCRYEN